MTLFSSKTLAFCGIVGLARAQYFQIPWQAKSVGPDGPWNVLLVGVDWPIQNMSLFPSLTTTSLLVNESSCSDQTAACPLPIPALWDSSTHEQFFWMNSDTWEASTWDASVSEPLRLQGEGEYIHQTFRMYTDKKQNVQSVFDQAAAVSDNFTINYPGGAKYTLSTGFYSLYGGSEYQNYTATNGSQLSWSRQLPSVYNDSITSSISYGLHIGSASQRIPGTLLLGGYDRARCLTEPVVSNTSTFQLQDIGLKVESGSSQFINLASGNATSLLQGGPSTGGLSVMPNPGVPYMYLPKATCDAIAQHLPVTYHAEFGLYFWDNVTANNSQTTASNIISSPHVLVFDFGLGNKIEVPFALLNLTLQTPLISTPTQYFPCSPYSPSDGHTYHLGRAFLQAAFLAQNWQTNTTWLAQAPGPDLPSEILTTIGPDDTTLAPMMNGPTVASTWSKKLTPLPGSPLTYPYSNSLSRGGGGGLSGGAIAGVVVGALIGALLVAALALLWLHRKKQARKHEQIKDYPLADQQAESPSYAYEGGGGGGGGAAGHHHHHQLAEASPEQEIYEIGSERKGSVLKPAELPSNRAPAVELHGSEVGELEGKWK